MKPVDWAVILGGLAAIAWINWYFFLAGRPGTGATVISNGKQKSKEGGQ